MRQTRSIRRSIRRPGLNVDLAADVNAVVSTGATSSENQSAVQAVSITQHRGRPVRDRSTRTEEDK